MKKPELQAGNKPPLLVTKLHTPALHQSLVPRPRLVEQLDQVYQYKLALVSAPAGYGKTTLLSQWLAIQGAERFQDRIAWVSLEDDHNLTRFWTYIFQAVETRLPGAAEQAQTSLNSPRLAVESAVSALINSISAASEEFLLILDDYDAVEEQAVHDTLAFFLEHLPANLHLVIASRIDPPIPMARLRLRGEMLELRAADLAFTTEEAANFLNSVMGLSLSPAEIAALEKRTEGWIAGLHAAAISLLGREDAAAFIQTFTGSQRFVMDFLVEEVLQRQSETVQSFLLATSILNRLSGPLCDAVVRSLERSNVGTFARSNEVLEYLERANLFIFPLDGERQWYRYHKLFADVLRQRLQQYQPGMIAEYHRRALEWYEQNGMLEEAVEHALHAGENVQAEHLIERIASPTPLAASMPENGLAGPAQTGTAALIKPLTVREIEVLRLLASGASNQVIAAELSIALTTAKKHVSNILHKLGASNRVQGVAKGRDLGFLSE